MQWCSEPGPLSDCQSSRVSPYCPAPVSLMQRMEICRKCGPEGLFIHTTGVSQMMRRKEMRDNMFHEILQASGVAHTEQRAWRSTLVDRMERDSAERRNTGKGPTHAVGHDSTSQAPDGHAGDSYRPSGPSNPSLPPAAVYR